jgi:hypothetical protein
MACGNRCSYTNFYGCSDHLHSNQRDQAHDGSADKGNAIINHPQQTTEGGQKNGRNVIDGKSDGHTGRYISGVSHLLKIGADGNGKVEKNMIQNIEKSDNQFGSGDGISRKNKNQA